MAFSFKFSLRAPIHNVIPAKAGIHPEIAQRHSTLG
jgi:hypothetical protein